VVEHNLAKVGVEGSNPFARSRFTDIFRALRRNCESNPVARQGWPRPNDHAGLSLEPSVALPPVGWALRDVVSVLQPDRAGAAQ
jgi:hypothetical protein